MVEYKAVTTHDVLKNRVHYHIEYCIPHWLFDDEWEYVRGSYSISNEELELKIQYLKDNKLTTLEPKTERIV